MIILGIETSCDETAAAILEQKNNQIIIRSNVVASSSEIQAKYGGIIPEQAAREQIKSIIPVIETALQQAQCKPKQLDAIAVTYGPGLIGSLLVGVETAKVLALTWKKPLIPINHLLGHFYANWIGANPKFPCLGLLVSGGHTDLVLFTGHSKYKYLGGTRDDAAGECFDKCARLLGLPYPGGPSIAQMAMKFKIKNSRQKRGSLALRRSRPLAAKFKIDLPRPLLNDKTFDFSFSGLKTAVLREVEQLKIAKKLNNQTIKQLADEIQQAIVDILVKKTTTASQKYSIEQIIIAGGVAANQKLSEYLVAKVQSRVPIFIPPPYLCTDNAAMIAAAAFFTGKKVDPLTLQANPNLALSY